MEQGKLTEQYLKILKGCKNCGAELCKDCQNKLKEIEKQIGVKNQWTRR